MTLHLSSFLFFWVHLYMFVYHCAKSPIYCSPLIMFAHEVECGYITLLPNELLLKFCVSSLMCAIYYTLFCLRMKGSKKKGERNYSQKSSSKITAFVCECFV